MLSVWLLSYLINFALSNGDFLIKEKPQKIYNISQMINYFKKSSDITLIYHSIESHQFDTNNVIKMITNDIMIYEINNFQIHIYKHVFYEIVLFLGYHFNNTLLDMTIFKCFIVFHSHQDINLIKEKFKTNCVKILLISVNGEYWTDIESKTIRIHVMKMFNRKPNCHKERITLFKISPVKEAFTAKDYLLQDILETKWNASIAFSDNDSSIYSGNNIILYHVIEAKHPFIARVHFLEQTCFIVAKSPQSPLWRTLVFSFTPAVWILLIFIARINTEIYHEAFNSLINIFRTNQTASFDFNKMFRVVVVVGQPEKSPPSMFAWNPLN